MAPTWVEAVIAPVNVRVKNRLSTRNSGSAVTAEDSALSEKINQITPVGRSLGSSTTASTRSLKIACTHTTYRGYKIAEQALPEKYSDSTTTTELGSFLDKGLVQKVLSAMDDKGGDGVCPACNVGVTSKAGDMLTLSLADFICSDFDSTVDNHEYPTRNCSDVDEKWASK